MKRTLITVTLLLPLVLFTALPVAAQDPDDDEEMIIIDRPGMGFRGIDLGGGMRWTEDDLKLTKEQQKQLREMRVGFQKEMIPLHAQMKVMRLELQELIRSDVAQEEINQKIDKIGALRTEIDKKQVAHRAAIRKILTPEQRETWDSRPHMRHPMKEVIKNRIERRGFRGKGI